MRSRSSALLFLSATLALACTSPPSAGPAPDAGIGDASTADAPPPIDAGPVEIAWGPCPSGFRDQCATVQMPLDHDDPAGEQIDVFLSRRGTGSRQLWLLQGGPGHSAESFYGLHDFLTMIDPELEVYTIEHRGVGSSTRLGCAAEADSSANGTQITPEEFPACRDEVVATWGDRLEQFTTTQAAHDLALAIERTRRPGQEVFVYGGSYGTYWANRYGVLHPEQPTGLILDAPVAPGSDLSVYDLQFEPVGHRIFTELCPTSAACSSHLGADPEAFLERVFASLGAGHCSSLGVDLATWKVVFGVFLMDYNLRNWLPALVYRLDRCATGDRQAIATLFGNIFGGGGGLPRTSPIMQLHQVLSEFFPRTHVDEAPIVAARGSAIFFQDALADAYRMQDGWPRSAVDPLAPSYAPPSVPVLVMAGGLDPAAPVATVGAGYRDHLSGPHQTFVEIPYGAHTVLTSAPVGDGMPSCSVQLVRAFLADPSAALPVSCAADVLVPSLDAPADLAMRFWGTPNLYD